jgi:hypothetical protein
MSCHPCCSILLNIAWHAALLLQVIAVPEIRHVTLPTTGGRLVIASDGVWDHMQPKSMIHQASDAAAAAQTAEQTTEVAELEVTCARQKQPGKMPRRVTHTSAAQHPT